MGQRYDPLTLKLAEGLLKLRRIAEETKEERKAAGEALTRAKLTRENTATSDLQVIRIPTLVPWPQERTEVSTRTT